MRKLILASASAIALFGISACSDTDETTTQSVPADQTEQPAGEAPAASPPAADNSTTQSIQDRPESGTGGQAPGGADGDQVPVQPAPAQ